MVVAAKAQIAEMVSSPWPPVRNFTTNAPEPAKPRTQKEEAPATSFSGSPLTETLACPSVAAPASATTASP